MNKKLLLIITLFLFSSWQMMFAQNTITGVVADNKDGTTIPGVSVIIKGTTTGTITDINGIFTIPVNKPDAILVFTFIGYIKQEIPVEGKTSMKVGLVQEAITLDEVSIVAFSTQKKRDRKTVL